MKWGETAHRGGFNWKKSPARNGPECLLCLSGGSLNIILGAGRGGGGGGGVSWAWSGDNTNQSVAQVPQWWMAFGVSDVWWDAENRVL